MREIAGFKFYSLKECLVKFDGGSAFGHVPKMVWSREIEADELNRIEIACNPLLVKGHGKTILIDPGMGTKWSEKEKEIYGLKSFSLEDQLAEHGVCYNSIDLVILTHLHLDHAGGITYRNDQGELALTFPNAKVLVQKGEWRAANTPDQRSAPSYRRDDFLLLEESGNLEFVDGSNEVFPGCEVIVTGAHTKKHQAVRFFDEKEALVFVGDLFPTSFHLKPNWVMGYDLYPLKIIKERQKWLSELAREKVFGYFFHDPTITFFQIRKSEDQNTRYVLKAITE